jgi:hypothetical protein
VRHFVRRFGQVDAAAAHLGARASLGVRTACQRDERDIAFARGDRFGRVRHVGEIRAAAHVGRVDVAKLVQVHVVRHAPDVRARRVTRTEVAVDVVLGESCVFERPFCDFRVQLRDRFIGRFAQRMLVNAGDVSLAFDGHDVNPFMFPWFQCGES